MQEGRVSQTALKVASTMVTLGAKRGWRERLPQGLPGLTEELIVASGVYPYTRRLLRMVKRPWAVRLSDLGERVQPGTFAGLGERKIFMDRAVNEAIEAGATQVLVLGAGFDTLCLRLAPDHPRLSFVEIDHPATGAAKQRGVQKLGQPPNLTLVAADLSQRTLGEVLRECSGWDCDATSVVVAEGLLYYLPEEAVLELFHEVANCSGAGSRVAFSHLLELDAHRLARVALRLGGEPWLSSARARDLPGYIGAGWEIIDTRRGKVHRDLEGFAVAQKSGSA